MVMEAGGWFPSEFTEYAFRMPGENGLEHFSFNGRKYLVPIYDTKARNLLLLFSRQCEKSTSSGNKLITYAALRPYIRSLFVSPSDAQTTEFSKERIAKPMRMSPVLQKYLVGKNATDNVGFKEFSTGSSITFRSSHFNADSCRGISCDIIALDELQSLLQENIPVIMECMSHSRIKACMYTGTPLSFDNPINDYWENHSDMREFVIPCDHCGGGDYRHWNIIGYDSIQPHGLSCNKCGGLINKQHPDAQWASMRSPEWLANPPASVGDVFEGYRICQPLVDWLPWSAIMNKKVTYGVAAFHNEVLALSYDSGEKLVRKQALINTSNPNLTEATTASYVGRTPLFMGIDWTGGGSTGNSYTFVTIVGYDSGKIAVPFMKRFTGREAEPEHICEEILKLITKYRISLVGCDYGGGLDKNDVLIRALGMEKVHRFQYCGAKKLYFDADLQRHMASRNECLMMMINAINREDTYMFPRWETWGDTHAEELLCLSSENDPKMGRFQIVKTPGKPDDFSHSLLYATLVSLIVHPRPDLMTPDSARNLSER